MHEARTLVKVYSVGETPLLIISKNNRNETSKRAIRLYPTIKAVQETESGSGVRLKIERASRVLPCLAYAESRGVHEEGAEVEAGLDYAGVDRPDFGRSLGLDGCLENGGVEEVRLRCARWRILHRQAGDRSYTDFQCEKEKNYEKCGFNSAEDSGGGKQTAFV
ncbi:50S ribosomal protein L25, partial [Striga asiatica]